MARLDRLGSAKEVAQIGAAIGREFTHIILSALASKPQPDLAAALDLLIGAGLLFRQGAPPHATYLFKHALVQDAAYGTLLREPRRALHARIAEALETQFGEIAESHPELVARHCSEAGFIEKAAGFWGKAGQRSLERSALVEAVAQLTRALDLIAALPATPALRREEIKFQVALLAPLMHVKGYAAPETKAAAERSYLLIEQAEARGELPEDPLLLFVALYGLWGATFVAFNGDVMRERATQFLNLAEKRGAVIPRMIGYRIMGNSLMLTGEIAEGRKYYDRALAIYDPGQHRPLATRFGTEVGVSIFTYRAITLWCLGHPGAALADTEQALKGARDLNQIATSLYALFLAALVHIHCGNYKVAETLIDELAPLAEKTTSVFWKAGGLTFQGILCALKGNATDAVGMLSSGVASYRSTGAQGFVPWWLSVLASAHADLGHFEDAQRCIADAITAVETTKEKWCEADLHRIAGEIALMAGAQDTAKARFERALAIARQQQAKSWELRAAMSMARHWREQGKRDEARELLAPVYGWFTEGFDTRDLRAHPGSSDS
jgi:predicted ATPase